MTHCHCSTTAEAVQGKERKGRREEEKRRRERKHACWKRSNTASTDRLEIDMERFRNLEGSEAQRVGGGGGGMERWEGGWERE